jgi:hypothetical protein
VLKVNSPSPLTCPFCFLTIAFGTYASEVEELERLHAYWEQDRRLFEQPTLKDQHRGRGHCEQRAARRLSALDL